jgi:L-asparaginase II
MERTGPRAFVKLGAEGVYGGGLVEEGIGFAIKVEDGAHRAVDVALLRVLEKLGALGRSDLEALDHRRRPVVSNTRGEAVGEIRASFQLGAP